MNKNKQKIIIEYPSKILRKAVSLINSRKVKNTKYVEFDYPEYAGLPKKIANKLNSDEVDLIQNQWNSDGAEDDD